MSPPTKPLGDFTLAVICPLEIEALSMIRQLDEGKHYGSVFSDDCHFRLGSIGRRNIVITSLSGGLQGNSSAAVAAQQTKAKFLNIQDFLLVGVAGGVPSEKNDIRLGEVVVSFPTGRYGGVVQYDYGKEEEKFKHNGYMKSVPQKLLAYLDSIKLTHGFRTGVTPKYIQYLDAQIATGQLARPDSRTDRLFPATYSHQGGPDCTSCDGEQAQVRKARKLPRVHYGLIASGNRVMKNGQQRDQYNQDHGGIILAYEMEAAGLMNFTPCLVIRGICDYSDSHKPPGKMWHAFAATAAASFAREFIEEMQVEIVRTHPGERIEQRESHWNVPFGRNKDFIGRETELDDLFARLDLQNEDDCERVAISGLGGIGKTQIALEAAFRVNEKFPDCSVFWVPAISATTFEVAYRDIGQKLDIPGTKDDEFDIKSLVKAFLSREASGRWLMIIDNADDLEMLFNRAGENDESSDALALVDYLPFSRKGSILITTRNSKVAVRYAGSNSLTLRDMSEDESYELFERSLLDKSLTRDKSAILDLLNLLSNLPLALKQAAAFINENSISVTDYLRIYRSSNEDLIKLLNESFEDNGRYRNTKNPITLTWLISFEQIERSDRLAAKYLYIMSCVAQQNIPHLLLPPASKVEEAKSIGTLKAYAFITERTGYQSYDMHRLVQLAVRNWLKKEKDLSFWSLKTLERIAEVFPLFEYERRDECSLLLPHTQYVLEFQKSSGESGDSSRKLLSRIGEYLWRTGAYNEGQAMYQRALELQEKVLGPEHLDTLQSRCRLAIVLNFQWKREAAEDMQRQTVKLYKKVLSLEHPSVLSSMNILGVIIRLRGNFKEAEAIHRQVLDLREKTLGLEHPETLKTMNNLATTLYQQEKYKEAETMYRRTMELMERTFSPEHPEMLNIINNLGLVLDLQRRYGEAETMHRYVSSLREKLLGPEHPNTLDSIENLGEAVQHQGKYTEAETIHRHVFSLRWKMLGSEHPLTRESIKNLTIVLRHQGKSEEAGALTGDPIIQDSEDIGEDDTNAPSTAQTSSPRPLTPPSPNPKPAHLRLSQRHPPSKPSKPLSLQGAAKMD